MNLAKTILFGIVIWAAIFIEVIILLLFIKNPNELTNIVHFIIIAIIIPIITLFYFKQKSSEKGFVGGIKAGIIFGIIAIILDSLIAVPYFGITFGDLYTDPYFWIGVFELVFITTIVGIIKK